MSLSNFSLKGKKALVVGARRNMGKAFALGLAEAGADVAITDINIESGQLHKVSNEIEAMDRKSIALKADISCGDDVKKLVDSKKENQSKLESATKEYKNGKLRKYFNKIKTKFQDSFDRDTYFDSDTF